MRYQVDHRMNPAARGLESMLARQNDVSMISFIRAARENTIELTRGDILAFADEHMHLDKAYTPDVVAAFMASLGMSHNARSVLDPTCGIGNLLYFCRSAQYLQGVDIDDTLTPAAYLVCPSADHRHADFLSTTRDRQFDLVIVHPPFGTHQPERKAPLEQLILEKSLECLSPGGVLVALVPPSLLWSASFSRFRDKVVRHYHLEAVIELWRGALQATAMGSAVVVISKRAPGGRVLFSVAENSDALEGISRDYTRHAGRGWIPISGLTGDWHAAALAAGQVESASGIEYVKLSDLGDVSGGMALSKKLRSQAGTHLIFSFRHVEQGALRAGQEPCQYVSEETAKKYERSILRPGDIVVALRYSPGKLYQVREQDSACIVPAGYAIVRSSMSGYLNAYLSIPSNRELLTKTVSSRSTGLTIRGITLDSLRDTRIPDLPLDNLGDLNQQDLETKSQPELESLAGEVRDLAQRFARDSGESLLVPCEADRCRSECATDVAIVSQLHTGNPVKRGHVNTRRDVLPALSRASAIVAGTAPDVTPKGIREDVCSLLLFLVQSVKSLSVKVDQVQQTANGIVQQLTSMTGELNDIKISSGSTEEALRRMASYMDGSLGLRGLGKDGIERLGPMCSCLLTGWDCLESRSQRLLMDAEYLLDVLSRSPDHDYSPCVLEYCRSLENELLSKVFVGFVPALQIAPLEVRQSVAAAASDKTDDDCKFAKLIGPCLVGKGHMTITLGQMSFELRRAVKPRRPLSRLFREYLESRTTTGSVLGRPFLDNLDEVVNDYRNPCAHTDLVDKKRAIDCRRFLPPQIDLLLGSLKNVTSTLSVP